ncbi:MAG TPA: NADH-quinone oxidoreductase subunit C [Planctomycetota bacterium]|nr:NADH-quinone oxidoreductase subunit C [Planctomycetota bacterium]
MSETELAQELRSNVGEMALDVEQPSRNNIFVTIRPEDITKVVRIVWDGMQSRFAIVTGIDVPGGIEILYHFVFDEKDTVVTLKTRVAKPFPEIESITPIIPGAEWIEREVHDLLGVNFRNHPRLERLILHDNWPEGVYPLRKDFKPEDAK